MVHEEGFRRLKIIVRTVTTVGLGLMTLSGRAQPAFDVFDRLHSWRKSDVGHFLPAWTLLVRARRLSLGRSVGC
jgi:hypothetical protein